ncbi:MAG: hypothetical protein CSA35_05915 [Dethiosulfovibrio peptidovorans]|nr:MAG: hypothetical protein CSA35_05915 [Dethiosulfovibrio peptidovorans]
MRYLLGVMMAVVVLTTGCGWAQEPAMRWGNWVFVEDRNYREFFPLVPVKGVRWFADSQGACFLQAVLPYASVESVSVPEWFTKDGMGTPPSRPDDDRMGWGRWVFMEGKLLRECVPPGPQSKDVRWFIEASGRCFRVPVVDFPKLYPVDRPAWLNTDGMGLPPGASPSPVD